MIVSILTRNFLSFLLDKKRILNGEFKIDEFYVYLS